MACWALCACACALAPAEEPYAELSGGKFIAGHGAPMNPDPLRDYVWNTTAMPNASALQLYRALPAAVHASPGANFTNAASLLNSSAAGGPRARALGGGTLVLDFGVELAAWLELRSPDLAPAAVAAGCVSMSVGESSVPLYFAPARLAAHVHNASNPLFAGWKTERPAPYAGGVFRLELNDQLYEGMRYGFLHVNASCGCFEAFTVESVVALAQVKPANWAGRFAAPGNPVLERAWYVGGYTVKLNLQEDAIGSILDQRGDRTPKGAFVGFAGDAHAAQAASMAAFGNFGLVRSMQQQLGQFDAVYGTYCMYWVLSLADFFAATADAAAAREMLPQAHEKMRRSFNRAVPKPGALVNQKTQYAGWDERFNFAKLPVYPENGYVMRALYVQASSALAGVAEAVGNATLAAVYRAEAVSMRERVRSGAGGEEPGNEWWRPYGLHASAHAANAGLINATEAPLVFASRFNDSAKICSFSNFNQWFVLSALATLGYPIHALASIELCWGAELALGATTFWEVSGYGGQWASALSETPHDGMSRNGARGGSDSAAKASPPVPGHSTGSDSKCHPWASGVTAWLTHEAAGLHTHACPPGAGSDRVGDGKGSGSSGICASIRPILDRVSATLPTPHGDLAVSIDATAGVHSLRAPCEVELVDVKLPLPTSCHAASVSVFLSSASGEGGTEQYVGECAVVAAPWASEHGLFENYVHLSNQTVFAAALAGACDNSRSSAALQVRVQCKDSAEEATVAAAASPPPPPADVAQPRSLATVYGAPVWDVPLVSADSAAQGGWIGKYGSRGHQLFGLAQLNGSTDLTAPFIAGVNFSAGKEQAVRTLVERDDPKYAAALQLPCEAGKVCPRAIGNVSTTSIEPMAIEISLRPTLLPRAQGHGQCVNISLYFVDWAGVDLPVQGWGAGGVQRKVAVDVFTVEPGVSIDVGHATAIASHPQISGGVYRTWRACASRLRANSTTGLAIIRFRVYVVTGMDAAISALFFD